MSYYTKKIPHREYLDTFIRVLQENITTARLNEERSIYCHIPADMIDEVSQYCKCHDWQVQLSHLTEGQAFYKVSGWKL